MRDIGFVLHDFKSRARWDWYLPDELLPGRLNGRSAPRRPLRIGRGGRGLQLEARRRVIHGAWLETWRRVNDRARKNLRLGLMAKARLDARRGNDPKGATAAGFDVRGANRAANQAHDLQVGGGDNQAGDGIETHVVPKAKPAGNLARKSSEVQIEPVNAGETNFQCFSRTRGKRFRL
jgi:hypothetical protein